MPDRTPTIYILAGCNGAGKTTFAREYLPHEVKCLRFLNADELARGLSPLDPGAGAFKAGRLLLKEVRDSISKREIFALETTLMDAPPCRCSVKRATPAIPLSCITFGWRLPPRPLRAFRRVRNGGHDVPAADVRRRFYRSLQHLIQDYLPLVSRWTIWDSRQTPPKLLAQSDRDDINQVAELLL